MADEKILILVVDDEKELLEIYQDVFELEGFRVLTAISALLALETYKNNLDIRVIISDSHMPGMSGIDFLKALTSTYQKIPLFYLSTGEVEQGEEDIKLLGGSGLILKPFNLDELVIKIKNDLKL